MRRDMSAGRLMQVELMTYAKVRRHGRGTPDIEWPAGGGPGFSKSMENAGCGEAQRIRRPLIEERLRRAHVTDDACRHADFVGVRT